MPIVSVEEFKNTTFDYIVVGGGNAGLTLAVRLSEDADTVVGVIEAGYYDPNAPEINIPGMRGRAVTNKAYDWTFFSTPQTQCNDRLVLQPRGKGLGGSSLLNYMCLIRPTTEEYDALEELGNKGWNWDSLLKYTKKSETTSPHTFTPEEVIKYAISPDTKLHGTDGPIVKSYAALRSELHVRLFDALEAVGVPRNPEPDGGRINGSFTCYTSVDPITAKRSYAASCYYEPNSARPNLLVLTGAHATKILLDDSPNEPGLKKAVGVEFIKDETTHFTRAPRRDVIISTGSFLTPQLLELSGIGNKAILDKFGVECKVDLPAVGENLQDHMCSPTMVELDPRHDTLDALLDPAILKEHIMLYSQQKGHLSALLASAFAYLPLSQIGSPAEVRTWQALAEAYVVDNLASISDPAQRRGREKLYALQRKWFADAVQPQIEIMHFPAHLPLPPPFPVPDPSKRYTTVLVAVSHPFSRGSVHIADANPLAPPAIDPAYFKNPADLEVLARGLRFALSVYRAPALRDEVRRVVLPDLGTVHGDGATHVNGVTHGTVVENGTTSEVDEKIKAYIRETVGPVFHPVGTAAMLPREEGGVVDDKLKVYGTSNLRVVDLSILPLELSSHTQTAAYAIGEMAADILRNRI